MALPYGGRNQNSEAAASPAGLAVKARVAGGAHRGRAWLPAPAAFYAGARAVGLSGGDL